MYYNVKLKTCLLKDHGAKTRLNEEVYHWESTGDLVEVLTEQCCYNCKTLVLCCGGHSVHNLLPELQVLVDLYSCIESKFAECGDKKDRNDTRISTILQVCRAECTSNTCLSL